MKKTILIISLFLLSGLTPIGGDLMAQNRGDGSGQGGGKNRGGPAECKEEENPTVTFQIHDTVEWVKSPEEMMEMEGTTSPDRGPRAGLKALNINQLIPKNQEYSKIIITACNGRKAQILYPHIQRAKENYMFSVNRRGKLKYVTQKPGGPERTIMRDVRQINIMAP